MSLALMAIVIVAGRADQGSRHEGCFRTAVTNCNVGAIDRNRKWECNWNRDRDWEIEMELGMAKL